MKRELVEQRIKEIVSFIDDRNLALALEENVKLFSEKELETLLGFLESGDYSLLYDLLQEKIEEYKQILDEIQMLRGKIKLEKIGDKEKAEKQKEEKELEKLITF